MRVGTLREESMIIEEALKGAFPISMKLRPCKNKKGLSMWSKNKYKVQQGELLRQKNHMRCIKRCDKTNAHRENAALYTQELLLRPFLGDWTRCYELYITHSTFEKRDPEVAI